jgi:HEAT repeat protein
MRRLATSLLLVFTAAAQDPSAAQRNDACFALRGKRSPEAIAAMRKAIGDPDVRACAARNLREAGAVESLLDALNTGVPDTRIAAARELGPMRESRALDSLGKAALDPNPLVASAAITALAENGDRAALPYLLRAAAEPSISGVFAMEQAARFHDAAVLPPARRVLAAGDVASQVIAVTVIGDLGDATDLAVLREIVAKSEPVTSRGRGFGLMPAIDLGRVAKNAIEKIAARQ